jgi:hypothetical protein
LIKSGNLQVSTDGNSMTGPTSSGAFGGTGAIDVNRAYRNKPPTSTSTATDVEASAASSVYGQPVTLTATVSPALGASSPPSGSVTFRDGSTILGTTALQNGVASLTITTLSVGDHAFAGDYSGDSQFSSSTSAVADTTVAQDGTSVVLTSSGNPAGVGQPITFLASVSPAAPGAGTATGSVTFLDGATPIGTVPLSGGSATFTTSALPLGSHALSAVYSGDTNFLAGTSAPLGQTVQSLRVGTVTIVSAKPRSTTAGRPVTLNASVNVVGPLKGRAGGSVTFLVGSTVLGTVALRGGKARFKTSSLPVGSDVIQVIYSGDGNFGPSASAFWVETVRTGRSKIKAVHQKRV